MCSVLGPYQDRSSDAGTSDQSERTHLYIPVLGCLAACWWGEAQSQKMEMVGGCDGRKQGREEGKGEGREK